MVKPFRHFYGVLLLKSYNTSIKRERNVNPDCDIQTTILPIPLSFTTIQAHIMNNKNGIAQYDGSFRSQCIIRKYILMSFVQSDLI